MMKDYGNGERPEQGEYTADVIYVGDDGYPVAYDNLRPVVPIVEGSIHALIASQTELAMTYAFDGAFHSAARVLRDLANQVETHAIECNKAWKNPDRI